MDGVRIGLAPTGWTPADALPDAWTTTARFTHRTWEVLQSLRPVHPARLVASAAGQRTDERDGGAAHCAEGLPTYRVRDRGPLTDPLGSPLAGAVSDAALAHRLTSFSACRWAWNEPRQHHAFTMSRFGPCRPSPA